MCVIIIVPFAMDGMRLTDVLCGRAFRNIAASARLALGKACAMDLVGGAEGTLVRQ